MDTDEMYEIIMARNPNDVALLMFMKICIDFCNEWDRIDLMYEMWEAMVQGNYKPTYNVFHSYMVHEKNPKYMPVDEDELNAVLDDRAAWKRSCEEAQNRMVAKFGVEWLGASGDERLAMMMKNMEDLPPSEDNNDYGYDDLPF